jgi:hypothetical protein
MEERKETIEDAKNPYEAPVLEEREDVLAISEGEPVAGISEGIRRVVP